MPLNFNELIKKEIVERFENVVKEEIRQHNLAIQKSNESLNELNKKFMNFQKDHKNLIEKNKDFYVETQDKFLKEKNDLEDLFDSYKKEIRQETVKASEFVEKFAKEKKNFLNFCHFDQIIEFLESKTDEIIAQISKKREEDHKKFEQFIERVESRSKQLEEKIKLFCESVIKDTNEKNNLLTANIVDAKGISRELHVYQKSIFIIEKKIENIYTLIERVNNPRLKSRAFR